MRWRKERSDQMGNFSRKWIKDLLLSKGVEEQEQQKEPHDPIRDKSESSSCVIINGTLFLDNREGISGVGGSRVAL